MHGLEGLALSLLEGLAVRLLCLFAIWVWEFGECEERGAVVKRGKAEVLLTGVLARGTERCTRLMP